MKLSKFLFYTCFGISTVVSQMLGSSSSLSQFLPNSVVGSDIGGNGDPLVVNKDGVGVVILQYGAAGKKTGYHDLHTIRIQIEQNLSERSSEAYTSYLKSHPEIQEKIQRIENNINGDDSYYAKNCMAVLQNNPQAKSGIYIVDPDGQEGDMQPFRVYCDMQNDGGGWLVLESNMISVPELSLEQYLSYVKGSWVRNGTEFAWEVRNKTDKSLVSLVKVKFDNTFEEWKNNHTGANPNLNASWSVVVPQLNIYWTDWHLHGIVRAEQYKTPSKAYPGSTSEGLHYKRTDKGEHFPWTDPDGTLNVSNSLYLCGDKTICGYEIQEDENPHDGLEPHYSIVAFKYNSIKVR